MQKYIILREPTRHAMERSINESDKHNYELVGPVVLVSDVSGRESFLATIKLKEGK